MLVKLTCYKGQDLENLVTIGLTVFWAHLHNAWQLGFLIKLFPGGAFVDKMSNTLHFRIVSDKNEDE